MKDPLLDDNEQNINTTEEYTAQTANLPQANADIRKDDNANVDSLKETDSDKKETEEKTVDSPDMDTDSEAADDDLKISEQETDENEDSESDEKVSLLSKIGIIAGVSVLVTAAAAAGFFTFSGKRRGKR